MTQLHKPTNAAIFYPESDGKPMAENTRQYRYIVLIKEGLEDLFSTDPTVAVFADLFWYPVQDHPEIVTAPDVYVVFGRPKGDRGSYQQWREDNVTPQVVFEIWSPSNNTKEKSDKLDYYARYGVQEYYNYDPETGALEGWERHNQQLSRVTTMPGWTSPRLQIRFELRSRDLEVYRPDGRRFLTYVEQTQLTQQERQAKEKAWAKLRELGIDPEKL